MTIALNKITVACVWVCVNECGVHAHKGLYGLIIRKWNDIDSFPKKPIGISNELRRYYCNYFSYVVYTASFRQLTKWERMEFTNT